MFIRCAPCTGRTAWRRFKALLSSHSLRAQDLLQDLEAALFDFPAPIPNVNTPEEWLAYQQVPPAARS